MFGFKKKKPASWKELSADNKKRVASKIARSVKAMAFANGARYKIVSGTDEWQRERGIIERRDED